MFISIQDDQGTDLWQVEFDYVEGDDDQLIKEIMRVCRLMDRRGVLKMAEEK